MAESLLNKIVREHYDTRAESGDEFTIEDVITDVLNDPTLDSVTDELVEAAVAGKVRRVDDARTARDSDQEVLFGDSDQVIPLGEGRRRRKGSMRLAEVMQHLALVEDNKRQVIVAAERESREAERLLPYLSGSDITWDEAVAMYEADHPEVTA